jgi:hypothetical protein
MMYNTQTLSITRNFKELFRKLDLIQSSGERKETPTVLGPLETANPNYGT